MPDRAAAVRSRCALGAVGLARHGNAALPSLPAFLRLERAVASRGGMPLIDLALLSDAAFMRGSLRRLLFLFANLSFYLVMTMFMQRRLHIPPLQAGRSFPPAGVGLCHRLATQRGARARHRRGTLVLIEGCAVQMIGLASLAPDGRVDADALRNAAGFGVGDFRLRPRDVMAPLSSAVLSTVNPASAGSGARDVRGTTAANCQRRRRRRHRRGVFAIEAAYLGAAGAMFAAAALFTLSIAACAAFLTWMRRAPRHERN